MSQVDTISPVQPTPSPDDLTDAAEEMIYRITHDLSASMRSLVQLSTWIAEDLEDAGVAMPADAQANVALLRSRGARLQNMMKDLLTYTCVGQSRRSFDGDWATLLESVRADAPKVAQFSVRTDMQAIPQIGHFDLQKLLSVLVSNAVKHHDHADDGCIEISANRVKNAVEICVKDDGPGIPAEVRRHLCKLLTSLEPRDHLEGSGMGLAIACKIAEVYGGSLDITDVAQDRGCLVKVTLPLQIT